jgi:uncharacterized membrane protein YphA (DoxX/SURF4 family)
VSLRLRDLPTRISTGVYVLHAGWDKWRGTKEQAVAVHGMAAAALPFLRAIPPATFLKGLAAAEIATGATLLNPKISNRAAGLPLTAFAAGLLAMYWRTPALHKPGSIWPTAAGTGISKDVWMLGIGLGLIADERPERVDEP